MIKAVRQQKNRFTKAAIGLIRDPTFLFRARQEDPRPRVGRGHSLCADHFSGMSNVLLGTKSICDLHGAFLRREVEAASHAA